MNHKAGFVNIIDLILKGDPRLKVERYKVNVRWTFGKKW